MPIDRSGPKWDAEQASQFYERLKSKGTYTVDQLNQFTVAWIMSRRLDQKDDTAREPWEIPE